MNENTAFEKQLEELKALQPQPITFKGKVRLVHFFSKGTAERFNGVLETASENDTMKDRHRREVLLLSLVLADLHGSSQYFKNLRRWIWKKRLEYTGYNEVEAMQLLEAAVQHIQQVKIIELHIALIVAQMQATIEAMNGQRDTLQELFEQKQKTWKGE